MAAALLSQARADAGRRALRGRPSSRQAQSPRRGKGIGEPVVLAAAISELLSESAWVMEADPTHGTWTEIVGEDIAKHVQPVGFDPSTGALRVRADSKAWASQLRFLSPQLVRRFKENGPLREVRSLQVEVPGSAGRSRPGLGGSPAVRPTTTPTPRPSRTGDPLLEAIRRQQSQREAAPLPHHVPSGDVARRLAARARALARARTRAPG
ncbi:DciA family protein [Streptomyces sp. NPDC055140]